MKSPSKSNQFVSLRYLFVCLLPVLSGSLSSGVCHGAVCKYAYTQKSVEVEGVPVLLEQYTPVKAGPIALVFMLHGSAGVYSVSSQQEPPLDNFGEKTLAAHCFEVILPHYFQALRRSSLTSLDEISENSPKLLRTSDILLTEAEQSSSLEKGPVFLYGESLGGFLATSLAFKRVEVRALSIISGGLIGDITAKPLNTHLSILISHGTTDELVPIAQALQLRDYSLRFGIPVTLETYKDVEHYFPPAQRLQCINRTEAFFTSLAKSNR